jgi:hypothetical protein
MKTDKRTNIRRQDRVSKREQERAKLVHAIDLDTISAPELQLISVYRTMTVETRGALLTLAKMAAARDAARNTAVRDENGRAEARAPKVHTEKVASENRTQLTS